MIQKGRISKDLRNYLDCASGVWTFQEEEEKASSSELHLSIRRLLYLVNYFFPLLSISSQLVHFAICWDFCPFVQQNKYSLKIRTNINGLERSAIFLFL